MRPGQGQRRGGRRNENRHGGHGGGGNGGQHRHNGQNQGQGQNRSAASLRNQIFDSNGPDMRVRGNAFQVHEKYQALAKDALSSGDRVLAENYLQHAEHYFRIIEAINEATAAEQRARQASWDSQPQPNVQQQPVAYGDGAQPPVETEGRMEQNPVQDLTQGSSAQQGQGQQGQDGQYQNGQQNYRRRENNRDNNRDHYSRNQQRYGGGEGRGNEQRGNEQRNHDQRNQDQQQARPRDQADYQPYNQAHNQTQSPVQSQDPLYDGVDEDTNDSPDTQAAIGGRR